ncbi:DDB1- and CUL4-associated factor 11-like [Paramacrobiotus metropolitanus]|uniref:DDB1- and CUL4-associated factor 11-like n=1 Tax=Paramacrobiotus metropolitanus TaxID=2943436 RepID=UPI002445AC0E|nr:DDB1- and CUL4-associated factor 11-like [Paramacrobiotus metropolitanus]
MGARNSHEEWDGDGADQRMDEESGGEGAAANANANANAPANNAPDNAAADRPALEPRRHQGGQRAVDILSALDYLYRTGQLRVMPRRGNRGDAAEPATTPTPQHPPDTTAMDRSDFKHHVMLRSGLMEPPPTDYPRGLVPLFALREFRPFRPAEKVQLMQNHLPSVATKLMELDDKLFCGLHSLDGNILMSAGQDQRIRLFDTSKSHTVRSKFDAFRTIVARDVGWSILDVRLSTCGRFVAYGSWSDAVHVASVHSDSVHVAVPLNPGQPSTCGVFSLMFSHDDQEILCGVNQGDIYVCNLTGRSQCIVAHQEDVNCVAFADHSSQILYSAGDDGIIKVWDRRTLSESRPRPCGYFVGHKHGITFLDPHFDGRHVLSNGKDQCIKLWDLRAFSPQEGLEEARKAVNENQWDYRYRSRRPMCTRRLRHDTSIMTYTGHVVSQTLIRARFSPFDSTASRYIVTGDATGMVYIFDSLSGEIIKRLRHHDSVVRDVSWHPVRPEIVSTSWDGCQTMWTCGGEEDEEMLTDDDDTMRGQLSSDPSDSEESG